MAVKRVVSSVLQRQVRYITAVPPTAATGLLADVYGQVAGEMRVVIPPILAQSPSPASLAAYWMLTREALHVAGRVDRARKEVVAAAVSVANTCPYCADMHSMSLYDLSCEQDAEAIVADRAGEVGDPGLRAVAGWARVAHRPDEPVVRQPPFTALERPELVGVAVTFHYLTRVVNVFLPGHLVPRGLGPGNRRRFKHGVSRFLAPLLRKTHAPGRTLALLRDAELPQDAAWAQGAPVLATAVARSFAALDAVGLRALSPAVRHLVRERLTAWRGEDPGLSREWCERLIADLPEADRAAGRLALLTVFASYQVDEGVVAEFRARQPGDAALVEVVTWASYAAARQVGARLVDAGQADAGNSARSE
ncbi:carboxymuconolactone decarboxylase family protein [Dactylosporangium sp. NPDC005555]|uniref:carboxymuconolactone decarboxylase family protein n=1 Tax=Dactylosporangium sp. NPDC005555 TaxID=3154889 RepID=UPI0033A36B74